MATGIFQEEKVLIALNQIFNALEHLDKLIKVFFFVCINF